MAEKTLSASRMVTDGPWQFTSPVVSRVSHRVSPPSKRTFVRDRAGAQVHQPYGIAFVTNQELTLAQRKSLVESARPNAVELYHLERIATVLDNPAMAEVRKQFLNVAYEEEPTAMLGGQGGSTPAAGGGGGGAIGSGSRGGDGGPGGRVIFAGGQGRAPGAGGGGAGALGENMQGGQGGGGGDLVHVEVGPEELHELRLAGFQRIDLRVGKGGESGEQGEDTIANFVTADGTILKSIVARGGRPGAAPKPLARSRDATVQDIDAGLRVTSVMLAECVQLRHGLLYLLGASWEHFQFPTVPFEAHWPLALTIDMGSLDLGSTLDFYVIVKDPTGFQVVTEPFSVSKGGGSLISRPNLLVSLSFTGSQTGVWTLEIISGGLTLSRLPIEIKGPQLISSHESSEEA